MRAVIIANGPMPKAALYERLIATNDLIVCVDGGVKNALALGFKPQVVVGDLDSLDPGLRKQLEEAGCRFVDHPSRKDATDSELAVLYALSQGATEIVMLGALGGRIDHALANVMLLALPELKGIKARIIDVGQEILLIGDEAEIDGEPGDTLSLLPLTGDVTGVYTQGLEYPLQGGTLKFGAARGVSNVLTAPRATVRVGRGLLLAVHTLGCSRTAIPQNR